MTKLSAAEKSQTYNELAQVTSPATAEAIMQSAIDVPWDTLVTKDHLDSRLAQIDAKVDTRFAQVDARFAEMNAHLEQSLRSNTFRILTTIFAFNGALVAAMAAIH